MASNRQLVRLVALGALGLSLAGLLVMGGRASHAQEQDLVDRGSFLFEMYCASCHGKTGVGNGPTADVLKVRPSDLTRLSKQNAGEFPFSEVYRSIDGRREVRGHGSSRMPIWGLTFQEWDKDANQEDEVRGKVLQLIEFIKTLQEKD